LAEAAFIDGAGHVQTLIHVYIPVSLSAFATIALFTMVGNWNAWFDALIYISDKRKYPMATLLHILLSRLSLEELARLDDEELRQLSDRTVKAAQIFIAITPIIAVYPFLQRYFIQGIKLGSVKE
jgi:putative aldouronate transport system permease protein